MPDVPQLNDLELTLNDIAAMENAEEVIHFFAKLGYDVSGDTRLTTDSLSIENEDLRHQIQIIRKIGTDPKDAEIEIYLFELRAVTVAITQAIVRQFRQRSGSFLFVLTQKDYERIDFVLLDRIRKENTSAIGGQIKYVPRPRILTVHRHRAEEADRIALRVLRRFTFTEADGLSQWEKLRSAYTLAEWTEPNFNNRALFSDYYLNQRLTDPTVTPEWAENYRLTERKVMDILSDARRKFTGQSNEVVWTELIEPLFTLLGFEVTTDEDGYNLHSPGQVDTTIAWALAYSWNRNLDDSDPQRDPANPDEIPGAKVVTLLEKKDSPAWVIVTNGKLWRLYSATTSNKATNYYEVDLEEALFAPESDRVTAFKYWWLMFRQQAFQGFLDGLLAKSADYAQELREALKKRVFESIFPYFGEGFIENMRLQGVKDIDLDLIFSGTMTFLYRLMFALYAESLELLPVKEEGGYGDLSLYNMKKKIADVGGTLEDEAPKRLAKHYSDSKTDLYTHLLDLFHSIDKGDAAINLPVYNGGLFSGENESGAFLERYAIPDRYLAMGLDRLSRDVDSKTGALVFIDFKSLGVRQLGSVYEGLLEFKLRIAAEKLAVIKEKSREVYKPFTEAKGRVLATLEPGTVYLENTRQERKASGSYYTPDYIVKYIVEHTVGPVLEAKFAALTPRLREAQKQYRQNKALALAKKEDPSKFWNSDTMHHLADDCLDVRVLDPAMGSGHFLVEVVDFVSNRLITFLNAWSENPVWALLERTRADIVDDVLRQGVTIDAGKLTRVALLKRTVLKRCVYGVDLNLMAVELAKVSLWLDAFTLGAPLSFLDHHLKHGNSLIGAFDLADVVAVGSKRWELILEAAAEMVDVSKRTDSTIGQVRASKEEYEKAKQKLEDVKKYANIPTAAYFVDRLIEYRKSAGKRDHQQMIAQIAQIAYSSRQGDTLQALYERSQETAASKTFFHWKLEFPEVFIDLNRRAWTVGGGFDAVVGNPPWGIEFDNFEKDFFRIEYNEINVRTPESYNYFIGMMRNVSNVVSKAVGVIVPNTLLTQYEFWKTRKLLSENATISRLVNLGDGVFEDVTAPSCMVIFTAQSTHIHNKYIDLKRFDRRQLQTELETAESNNKTPEIAVFTDGFIFKPKNTLTILEKCYTNERLRDIAEDVATGISSGLDEAYVYDFDKAQNLGVEIELLRKLVIGGEVDRYTLEALSNQYVIYLTPDIDIKKFPVTEKILEPYKSKLIKRREAASGQIPWYSLNWPRRIKLFEREKILIRQTSDRIRAVFDTEHWYGLKSILIIQFNDRQEDYLYFVALLNSNLLHYVYSDLVDEEDRIFPEVKPIQLFKLPIKTIAFVTPVDRRIELVDEAKTRYERNLSEGHAPVLIFTAERRDAGESDVVHDLLAFLAETMIDMNKRKQAEVTRFLKWLEDTLKIIPKDNAGGISSLEGKTIIQGYLGDYQKGEAEKDFDTVFDKLFANRRRFHVSLAEVKPRIEDEYARSLAVLLPIKRQLEHTDTLIDRIVYQLYGLTDDEIRLIEGPQYEQAVAKAKETVLRDETFKDREDEALSAIGDLIQPAAQRLDTVLPPVTAEANLDSALPGWRNLPERARNALRSAERQFLETDETEFTGCVVNYAKAVEISLNELLFLPFRAAGYSDQDVENDRAFKPFMRGQIKGIMLGSMDYVLSSRERAFHAFVLRLYPNAETTIFSKTALRSFLTQEQIERRNRAAHEDTMERGDAEDARGWAIGILGYLQ